jgi:nicotinate-nucleotide pyrophosphorylase (carboxylating)
MRSDALLSTHSPFMDWHSEEISDLVSRALAEDVGSGDATTLATVSPRAVVSARILSRQTLVCAGLPLVARVFHALDPNVQIECLHNDGSFVEAGAELVRLAGNARAILTGERTALNFLAHLCGIATLTRRFVEQLAGTKTRIRDTRKTTPGLRALEKYAVKTGGGNNHRFGLYDAVLLKENHVALAGGISQALAKAHTYVSNQKPSPRTASAYDAVGLDPEVVGPGPLAVQIEVRNERELREAVGSGAESVLLDNMSPDEALRCVGLARVLRSDCVVEISGGITLDNAREYAETGADFLSAGALTHSAPAANLTLLVVDARDK